MVRPRGFLDLPAELQLQIVTYLAGGVKHAAPAHELCNLALTCRQLALTVREALCLSPVLQSSKVHLLLSFLFAHPRLATKIKNLTIETKETRKDKGNPVPIPHLEPHVLDHCKRHIRTLPISQWTQDTTISALKVPRFSDHGLLICVLLTMLPQLSALYLGGSILLNYPFLHAMIPNEPDDAYTPDWAMGGPDLRWALALLGPRLTALELPIDCRRSADESMWVPLTISQLPVHFPNLRWLSVPHMTVTLLTQTSCADIAGPQLQTLVLTDARCNCFDQFALGLVDADTHANLFPALQRVHMYHRYPVPPADEDACKALADAGIELMEVVPECCLRSGDEFYHPWKYAPAELEALSEVRHAGYKTEWERAALLCDSEED